MSSTSLSIFVSTMYGRGLLPKFANAPYVIVDQGNRPAPNSALLDNYHFMNSRGLSLSRNEALRLCQSKYLLFADDDVIHLEGGVAQIVNEFESTGADIVTFMILTPDGERFKEYRERPFTHSFRSLLKVNSIEIAVRVNSVRQFGLSFDTRFGLGSKYPTGEEVIFLLDAYRSGLNIRFAPIPIVIHPKESSGSSLANNVALIQAKGAMLGRIFGVLSIIPCIAFAFKHYRKSGFLFVKFLFLILFGASKFLFAKNSRDVLK